MDITPAIALAFDRVLGEPPARAHPVVWMGRYCGWAGARLQRVTSRPAQVVAGGVTGAGGVILAVAAARTVRRCLRRVPRPLAVVLEGAVLSTLLSARMLHDEVAAVEHALATDEDAGRRAVARLVSRNVSRLDASAIRQAAIESLAENTSDSIVAPLWWYAVAGLEGAAAYRFVNTADAMWGYRTAAWEWRGKAAALVDDLLNWWPARLTAPLLAPRVFASAGGVAGARRIARTAAATTSPNAGWPMGALALALNVRLEKPGVYILHDAGRAATPTDTVRALTVTRQATVVATAAAAIIARTP